MKANPVSLRLQRLYGITLTEYRRMLREQGGKCAICGAKPKPGGRRLHVDHDHRTGAIRGALCWKCNAALRWLRDDPAIAASAARYLRQGGFKP
jgi:hypothetical protein